MTEKMVYKLTEKQIEILNRQASIAAKKKGGTESSWKIKGRHEFKSCKSLQKRGLVVIKENFMTPSKEVIEAMRRGTDTIYYYNETDQALIDHRATLRQKCREDLIRTAVETGLNKAKKKEDQIECILTELQNSQLSIRLPRGYTLEEEE